MMRSVDTAQLRELTRLLQRPGAVAPAEGLVVTVRSLNVSRGYSGDELVIRYSVPPLPDGIARQPLPRDADMSTYAREVAEELNAWAIGHVREYRPPPPLDRAQVARQLPSRDDLWRMLRDVFREVRDLPEGFVGTNRFDVELSVVLTPEQWQDYVVAREIGCRNDYGVDADSSGAGPGVAMGDLDEAMATLDPEESFLVLDGDTFTGSTRAELPPVPGAADERVADDIRQRGGGRWYATSRDGELFDPLDE